MPGAGASPAGPFASPSNCAAEVAIARLAGPATRRASCRSILCPSRRQSRLGGLDSGRSKLMPPPDELSQDSLANAS